MSPSSKSKCQELGSFTRNLLPEDKLNYTAALRAAVARRRAPYSQGSMQYRGHDVTWAPCRSGVHVGTLQTRVYGPGVAANGYRSAFKTFYCVNTRGMCKKIDLLLAGKRRNPYPPAPSTVIHERLRATLSK